MRPALLGLFLPVALLVAPPATAQQEVTFRGKVEDGESVCYYCPGFGFVLDNTKVKLFSSAYPLQPLIGSQIRGVGMWNGSTTAPSIDITFLEVVPESFSIGGGGDLGGDLSFNAQAQPGDLAVVAMAFNNSAFLPFPGTGVMFLDPASLVVLGSGTCDGHGEYTVDVLVPDNPALAGLNVFGQALVVPSASAPYTTNNDLKTLG